MISEFMCITPACNNMATEIDYRVDPTKNNNGKYPCYCICCMKGHTLLRTEYSNCFTNVECAVSSCVYEERIEDAIGCKEVGKEIGETITYPERDDDGNLIKDSQCLRYDPKILNKRK